MELRSPRGWVVLTAFPDQGEHAIRAASVERVGALSAGCFVYTASGSVRVNESAADVLTQLENAEDYLHGFRALTREV